MKSRTQQFALILAALLVAATAFAVDKAQSFTGTVSDAMCGAHHMMSGPEADCTRACVSKGSKYALVVGDKVYTLDSSDKATLASLDKAAGTSTTVKGTLNGDTIEVASVGAGK
jgi:hypothetical protein